MSLIKGTVAGHFKELGLQGKIRIEPLAPLPEVEEHLLQDIVGRFLVLRNPCGVTKHRAIHGVEHLCADRGVGFLQPTNPRLSLRHLLIEPGSMLIRRHLLKTRDRPTITNRGREKSSEQRPSR